MTEWVTWFYMFVVGHFTVLVKWLFCFDSPARYLEQHWIPLVHNNSDYVEKKIPTTLHRYSVETNNWHYFKFLQTVWVKEGASITPTCLALIECLVKTRASELKAAGLTFFQFIQRGRGSPRPLCRASPQLFWDLDLLEIVTYIELRVSYPVFQLFHTGMNWVYRHVI